MVLIPLGIHLQTCKVEFTTFCTSFTVDYKLSKRRRLLANLSYVAPVAIMITFLATAEPSLTLCSDYKANFLLDDRNRPNPFHAKKRKKNMMIVEYPIIA